MSQHIAIRIQSRAERGGDVCGVPIFPEHGPLLKAEPLAFGILEGGMQSGKVSVGLIVQHGGFGGEKYSAEMSGEMFLTLAAAVKGAMERFGQKWEGA